MGVIELQRKLMADHGRNTAFAEALKKVIVPDQTTVLDLGAGTGFLSFLAEQLGAKACSLVESGDISHTARKLIQENKMQRCKVFSLHSSALRSHPKVDILLSETLGNFALEENIIESIEDAKRFLMPGGIIIPGKVRQYVCPIIDSRLWKEVNVWEDIGFGLRFDAAKKLSLNNMYVKTIKDSECLQKAAAAECFDAIDFSKRVESIRKSSVEWKIDSFVTVYGLAVWWEAELVPGVMISTSPLAAPTHWEQIYFPVLEPISLQSGDTLSVSLTSDSRWSVKINVTWSYDIRRVKGKSSLQQLDMRKGFID